MKDYIVRATAGDGRSVHLLQQPEIWWKRQERDMTQVR